jgi:flagellin-like protein
MRANKNPIKFFSSRKAVSPLIATVLLIAFAVALGAVVMNWGRGYVEDTANIARERSDTEVTCTTDVGMAIVEIDSVPQVCYNDTGSGEYNLSFIVENKKEKTIETIKARLIGTATRVPLIVALGDNANMTTNTAKYLSFEYNKTDYGTPQQLQLTPYIKVGANEVGCAGNSIRETNIKPCSEIWT